jgi:hypothetical protein
LIDEKGDDDRRIARVVLRWLVGSNMPISLCEINAALLIEVGSPTLDEDLALFSEYEILRVCGSLVAVYGNTLRISHFTVQVRFH